MKNESIHSMLLALVGGYLIYLAYQLFDKFRNGTKEMPDAVFILAIISFASAGTGILIWAWMIHKKEKNRNQESANTEQEEQKKDN